MAKRNEFENFSAAVMNGNIVDKDEFNEEILPAMGTVYRDIAHLTPRQVQQQVNNLQTLFESATACEQAKLITRVQNILAELK